MGKHRRRARLKTVTVQGGALWGDVYEVCKKAKIDVVGALFWFISVGGYFLGAGSSPLTGKHGLAIHNVLGATVGLADGRIMKTSPTKEPDLFWAIRGQSLVNYYPNIPLLSGLNQFGVVVEFILKACPPQGPFSTGTLTYPGREVANVVSAVKYAAYRSTLANDSVCSVGVEKNSTYLNMAFVRPHFEVRSRHAVFMLSLQAGDCYHFVRKPWR